MMLKKIGHVIVLLFSLVMSQVALAELSAFPLMSAPVNVQDLASLQRGAKLYMNFCQGCHSLQYVRYSRVGRDIGITDRYGRLDEQTIKENLIFTQSKISDVIQNSLSKEDAKQWFGTVPPDLSLVARSRGVDWLYTYLLGFYQDETRPWGVNNHVFKDVGMPNVLESLQDNLQPEAFEQAVADIVNFLDYVGEPYKQERKRMGIWVIGFLFVLLIFAYLLKRAYWKDIH